MKTKVGWVGFEMANEETAMTAYSHQKLDQSKKKIIKIFLWEPGPLCGLILDLWFLKSWDNKIGFKPSKS